MELARKRKRSDDRESSDQEEKVDMSDEKKEQLNLSQEAMMSFCELGEDGLFQFKKCRKSEAEMLTSEEVEKLLAMNVTKQNKLRDELEILKDEKIQLISIRDPKSCFALHDNNQPPIYITSWPETTEKERKQLKRTYETTVGELSWKMVGFLPCVKPVDLIHIIVDYLVLPFGTIVVNFIRDYVRERFDVDSFDDTKSKPCRLKTEFMAVTRLDRMYDHQSIQFCCSPLESFTTKRELTRPTSSPFLDGVTSAQINGKPLYQRSQPEKPDYWHIDAPLTRIIQCFYPGQLCKKRNDVAVPSLGFDEDLKTYMFPYHHCARPNICALYDPFTYQYFPYSDTTLVTSKDDQETLSKHFNIDDQRAKAWLSLLIGRDDRDDSIGILRYGAPTKKLTMDQFLERMKDEERDAIDRFGPTMLMPLPRLLEPTNNVENSDKNEDFE